jgi:hypothetical protein
MSNTPVRKFWIICPDHLPDIVDDVLPDVSQREGRERTNRPFSKIGIVSELYLSVVRDMDVLIALAECHLSLTRHT